MKTSKLLGQKIHDMALDCGFDDCGIIPIDDMDGFNERLQQREKRVPSSAFFYQAIGDLDGIKKRFPWAKSVIICTLWLGKYRYPSSLQGKYAKSFFLSPGNSLCKTMQVDCTHFENKLSEENLQWEGGSHLGFLSIGPLRYAAVMAGLGIIRKNNFFYTEKGSFVELIGYVINSEAIFRQESHLAPCAEKCHCCQDACPSGALKGPFTMSPLECVSYITTFGKGSLPAGMDDRDCSTWICGCDSCQDACPYNRKHDWTVGTAYPGLEEIAPELAPSTLVTASEDFIRNRVIPYTDHHIAPEETDTLRICAARSLRNQKCKR